jgi:predicted dehydrogenase
MNNAVLRVGIAGVAHGHAHSYIAETRLIAGASVAGVWDPDAARAQAFATHYQVPVFADLDALLQACDTLMIAAENAHHHAIVMAAAAVRKPTLCEKPLATTVADAHAMVQAFAAAQVQLGTAFPVRYSPAVRRLRDTVQGGSLGQTLMVRATNRGTYPGGWFGDPLLAGGGAVMDHTVHVTDLVRWIWQQEVVEVYAEAATRLHDIPVDDCGLMFLTLADGMVVSLDASWSRPAESYPTWGDVTMEVTAQHGIVNLDVFGPRVELYQKTTGRGQWVGHGVNFDGLMIADWLAAVRHDRPAPISGVDGLRAVQVVDAAYRSAASHLPEAIIDIG